MSATPRDYVTIVSGLPRSGTSMMMRMLADGGIPPLIDNIRKADEDNPEGYYEFEPVKKTRQVPSWVPGARGMVVKMVYRLLYDLPANQPYRVVFMRRRLEEVVKSQEVMLERKGTKGGDLSDERLLELFREEIGKCEDWLKRQPNFKFLYVDYNQMVRDPAPLVDSINRFFDGTLDGAKMLAVVNPRLYRQRK
jgi:hypothetical protein